MHFHHASKLVTSKNGLAFICRCVASPHRFHGHGPAVAAEQRPRAAPRRHPPEHPQPRHSVPSGRGRRRRHPANSKRVARVAPRRPHSNQQFMAQQNGQRHPQAAGQRRGLHHAGLAHRLGHRRHRLLALGQLLVAGPGGPRHHRGLTNAPQAPNQPAGPPEHRQFDAHVVIKHVVVSCGEFVARTADVAAVAQSRERLAADGERR